MMVLLLPHFISQVIFETRSRKLEWDRDGSYSEQKESASTEASRVIPRDERSSSSCRNRKNRWLLALIVEVSECINKNVKKD
jgi:hypothetical protein